MSSVDVFVPCYCYGHYLRQCVESVLTQVGVDVRVLIIDDASPDGSAEVGAQLAQADSRVTLLRHAKNKGHIATYNEGIEWTSADYALLLSADDYLLPGSLRRAAELMDRHPEVGFVYGKAVDFMENAGEYERDTAVNTILDELVGDNDSIILSGAAFIDAIASRQTVNIVRTPTAVVRTSLQKSIGGYRPELPHSGDLEMWLRFAAHAGVGIVKEYQAVYRTHATSMHEKYNRFLDLEQRREALKIFFDTCPLPNFTDTYRSLMGPLALTAVRYASWAFNDGDLPLSQKFSQLAIDMWPEVTDSRAWKLLQLKRRLGLTVSRGLVAAARAIKPRSAEN